MRKDEINCGTYVVCRDNEIYRITKVNCKYYGSYEGCLAEDKNENITNLYGVSINYVTNSYDDARRYLNNHLDSNGNRFKQIIEDFEKPKRYVEKESEFEKIIKNFENPKPYTEPISNLAEYIKSNKKYSC